MKTLTVEEMTRLMDSVADERLRLMIILAARHGLRASEVCKLEWRDVDLAHSSIICRRLKGSNTSTQAMPFEEVKALKDWKSKARRPSQYVFPSNRKGAIERHTFYRGFHAACLAVGIPSDKAHCHVLKHYCAVRLVEANVSLPIIQAALGHKNLSSTAIYARPSQEIVDKAMRGVFDLKGESCERK